jgi:hypothetical protein
MGFSLRQAFWAAATGVLSSEAVGALNAHQPDMAVMLYMGALATVVAAGIPRPHQ